MPSEITYDAAHGTSRWGHTIEPQENRLRYFKLLLDTRQEFPHGSRQDLQADLLKTGKSATDIVTDYLTHLHKHVLHEITKRWGEHMVSTTKIEYVLSVPAVWSDAAKDCTLKAATKAGIGPAVSLMSEPEAAMIYCLKAGIIPQNNMHVGDNYIVVDAGGGTVDLTTHEIVQIEPLELRESVHGTGGLCGAAFIDERFKALVRHRLGADEFEELCRTKRRA